MAGADTGSESVAKVVYRVPDECDLVRQAVEHLLGARSGQARELGYREERDRVDELEPGYLLLERTGIIDPPGEGHAHRAEPRRQVDDPHHRAALGVEHDLPAGELCDPIEQRDSVLLRQVLHRSLGDDEHRLVGRNPLEPARVGDRRADHLVVVALRIQAPPQLDHV
jgi:hypothetical protein